MARVYQTWQMGEAQVRLAIVDHVGMADLAVHRVSNWGEARGDALWFITRNREDANIWIYFGSPGFCDLKVCFVENRGEAGWLKPHRLKGRLSG